jgi:ABC-type enterochelin transport system ATPase subunit
MKIVMEKLQPEKLAKYLENTSLRVFGVTPISEGYRPDQEEKMQTLYNVEMLVLGELRDKFAALLEGGSSE